MSQDTVLAALKEKGMATADEVALLLDLNVMSVRRAIQRLRITEEIEFAGFRVRTYGKAKYWRVRE